VLVLADLEGWDYKEIADLMAVPMGTVKAWIFRARELLRRQLGLYAESRGYPSALTIPVKKTKHKKPDQ